MSREPLVYGNGRCAVCGSEARLGRLMCPPHWAQVPRRRKDALYAALRAWDASEGTLAQVRDAQNAAIEAVTGEHREPTLEGGEPDNERR
jgi:hypothetical protein